jgi:hypothetical protein
MVFEDKDKDRDLDSPLEWRRDPFTNTEGRSSLDRNRSKSRDVDPALMWAGPGEVAGRGEGEHVELDVEPKKPSMIRVVALTIIMVLTYFLGVSHNKQTMEPDWTDWQAVSSQAVTLNVPGMSRDLDLTQLQAQWVYFL